MEHAIRSRVVSIIYYVASASMGRLMTCPSSRIRGFSFFLARTMLRVIFPTRGMESMRGSTAKTAVIGMSKNVALEFAPGNIRVNVVCPGPTPTALNTPDQIATFDADFAAQCNSHMALDDAPQCTVQDQANAICFLASDGAAGITGQVLTVDHGMTI